MQTPEGAGRNFLSVMCCDYYFIKMGAEPFLNTTRNVQDFVENTTDCVQSSRNRLGCSDFMSSANLNTLTNDDDLESQRLLRDDDQSKKSRRIGGISSYFTSFCNSVSTVGTSRAVHYLTTILALAIILFIIYASFSV
jgi:hypothetical protein